MKEEIEKTSSKLSLVKEYYGEVLKSNKDLKTTACCSISKVPSYIKDIFSLIDDEVHAKFYGCGSPIPQVLEGMTVLDLGCGSGRDCFVFSKLVGENGKVIGVDMTEAQLEVAKKYQDSIAGKFSHKESNINFKHGYIEDLKALKIPDNSIDIITSNCVINLSPNKEAVFSEIFRVLKPGGQLYFSDVFSSRRVPKEYLTDSVLLGECLSGALYIEDFRRLLSKFGCLDYRIVESSPIDLLDEYVIGKLGQITFRSLTVSAFKLSNLEDKCEDYGQVAKYLGTVQESPLKFVLDANHIFEAHKPMLVCGNTASMLLESRLSKHFEVDSNRSKHFGIFNSAVIDVNYESETSSCC